MRETERPILYYLFPEGRSFKIVAMTELQALLRFSDGCRSCL